MPVLEATDAELMWSRGGFDLQPQGVQLEEFNSYSVPLLVI